MYFDYLVKENIEIWHRLELKKTQIHRISYQDRKKEDKILVSETKNMTNYLKTYVKQIDLNKVDLEKVDIEDYYSEELEEAVKKTCQKIFNVDLEKLDDSISDELKKINRQFLKFMKEDGIRLNVNEFSQAIRNLWVMNFLQLSFQIPLTITKAMYAYSMLYPLVDNYLDDTSISTQNKKQFCKRFEEKIANNKTVVHKDSQQEKNIFKMIDHIAEIYSRTEYKGLYLSLLSILDGQILSMKQSELDIDQQEEVMRISFYKGGSSVLADAYLIKGQLTKEEESFAFSYGVLLQMIDDLEDIKEDDRDNSMTLPLISVKSNKFDKFLNQLSSFRELFYEEKHPDFFNENDILQNVSYQGVMNLMNYAIGNNRKYLTYRDRKAFQSEYKYTFKKLVKIKLKRENEIKQILNKIDTSKIDWL